MTRGGVLSTAKGIMFILSVGDGRYKHVRSGS